VSDDEAEALLEALKDNGLGQELRNQVEAVIKEKTTETETGWICDIKNDTSVDGLTINSSGKSSVDTNISENQQDYKKGDYYNKSTSQNVAFEVTKDTKSDNEQVTLIKKSTVVTKQSENRRQTITAVNGKDFTYTDQYSELAAYGYGLTIRHNDKAGKIIFEASYKETFSGTLNHKDGDDDDDDEKGPEPTITVSGSLKVYGSGDTPVYDEPITKSNYEKVFEYFGVDNFGLDD
jgi:hypothetical protein